MKYAHFDENGLLIGIYNGEAYPPRLITNWKTNEDGSIEEDGTRANPDCDIPAEVKTLSEEQYDKLSANPNNYRWAAGTLIDYVPLLVPEFTSDVNRERDKRILQGFTYNGHLFQADEKALQNINGVSSAATIALIQQVDQTSLRWHGGDKDFAFIAMDNTAVPMTLIDAINFGLTAMAHVNKYMMRARELKNAVEAGEEFNVLDDAVWEN